MAILDGINRLKHLAENIKSVPDTVGNLAEKHKAVVLSLNREQMLLGRDASGNLLTPQYTDDPFFKTPKKAMAYRRMKLSLEASHTSRMRFQNAQLYSNKPSNTPNLIVRGNFQDGMFIHVFGNSFEIGSTYIDASDIHAKYNNNLFGLAPHSRDYFARQFLKEELLKKLLE